jgi:hypothetical protein
LIATRILNHGHFGGRGFLVLNKWHGSEFFLLIIKRLIIPESNELTRYQQENREIIPVQIFNSFGFGIAGLFQIE